MPRPLLVPLVVLQVAIAAVLLGLVEGGAWMGVGIAVGVLVLLALVPYRRRSLYLVVRSWLGMRMRRRTLRGQGMASLVGGTCEVVTVPRGSGGVAVGAIRDATTWTVPLSLPLIGVFNDDPPIPLEALARLLTVEDVPLSSVRVVSLHSPASPVGAQPGGLTPGRLANRFLVLTLDTVHAADVIAARGGTPAVQQILRRCVLRAEEVFNGAGVAIRRLPANAVQRHHASSLGALGPGPDGLVPPALERSDHVVMAGTTSMTFAVTGTDAVAGLGRLAETVMAPLVATSVVVQPGPPPQHTPSVRLLLRISGPDAIVREVAGSVDAAARQLGLGARRLVGEQVPELRATTLLGVPVGAR